VINDQVTVHLIFGALGQDGSYLAEQLSAEGNQIIGVIRNSSVIPNEYRHENINYVRGDILDTDFVYSLLETFRPTHIYNLASASSVSESYLHPQLSLKVNLEFVQELIKNIEKYRTKSGEDVFLLQASSSEMYGPDQQSPIIESTAHDPRSPYAEHKSRAHYLCLNARETKDLRIGTAILFNHESPRRPLKFVSRKISHGAFAISQGREKKLVLGNINVQRDWGYAPDYVEAMSLIAQSNLVDDFVLATGKLHSLEDMCRVAFKAAGLGDFSKYVDSDQSLFRTVENSGLVGVAEKAHQKLNWSHRVSFELMIEQMVNQESVDTPSSAVSM
jgi:GDPmannose 4,6-dehydratase